MKRPVAPQTELFPAPAPSLPEGMVYEREFLTREEEQALVEVVAQMPLEEMRYKNYTARRRVVSFGGKYDFSAQRLEAAAQLPQSLEPLRRKVAHWAKLPPESVTHCLVAEYREGTPLGWQHSVAPARALRYSITFRTAAQGRSALRA